LAAVNALIKPALDCLQSGLETVAGYLETDAVRARAAQLGVDCDPAPGKAAALGG